MRDPIDRAFYEAMTPEEFENYKKTLLENSLKLGHLLKEKSRLERRIKRLENPIEIREIEEEIRRIEEEMEKHFED